MELRQLQYFVLVAELKSFSRASAEAKIAQPALSRYIRNLEEELGLRLFHRDGRGVILNEDGERFYKRVKVILRRLRRAVADVQDSQTRPRGKLTLGVPPHLGASFIASLVEEFHERYPEASLSVVEGFSRYIIDWLEIGRVDLGILYDPKSYRYIHSDLVFEESLFLVGSRDSPLTNAPHCELKTVADLPLIVPNRPSLLLDRVDEAFARINRKTPTYLNVDSFAAIKTLVREGKGYSVLAYAAIYEEIARNELSACPIINPSIERRIVLALQPKAIVTFAGKKLIELIHEQVRREKDFGHWFGKIPPR